ncbi:DNA-binding response regulator, OmpR family, contains REC and winged-helix (wHTH) domain [Clostridium collagenovorans DSM 3089]|uniref:Stage 0 sporulation protein A homolog n=1 Tax=Clostridium collagenovorans DSM 3089 TaxID=1121306 RepID=A0A1M5V005_9CLOT|nr:response regulator transcription factor [Clostridium collagenovorans]SHH68637.1 DNA-binding response regulator, OmpR family, contains REC and winged-helix (wHTH) domain [Clostridium collagenovorans DSM 3089]
MAVILIVEDDKELREELHILLEDNGYTPKDVNEFSNTKEEILLSNADLVLLDIKIPYINGQQLLRSIRKESDVPIIMLTSKNSEADEVLSMSYGADDYITKPYNPVLLLLRIEALLKRTSKVGQDLTYKNIKVNLLRSTLECKDEEVLLSKNEISIFYYMLMHRGEIVSRDDIINYLWGNDRFIDDNTLTVNINRLRKKLEGVNLKSVIETRRDQGYILI